MNKKHLIEARNRAVAALQALVKAAKDANRGLTVDEDAQFDKMEAEITRLDASIERFDKLDTIEASQAQTVQPSMANIDAAAHAAAIGGVAEKKEEAYKQAFSAYLRGGMEGVSPEARALLQGRYVSGDMKAAAQTVTTTGGGYLIPQGFSGQLEEALKFYGGILGVCSSFDTETGNPLPWPTVNDTGVSGRILGINTAVTNTAYTFGQVLYGAFLFSSDSILVPVQLMQDSYFDLDAFIARTLGTRLGRILNNKLTVGAGTTEPYGLATQATLGKTGANGQTTSIIYDDLVDVEHAVDPAYRPTSKFMFSDKMFQVLKKIKDTTGRPLWMPGLMAGFGQAVPNTIAGYQYVINQDIAAPAAGATSLLFGDFSKYQVRRVAGGTTVLRLVERYADYLQVGYIGFLRADGNLLDAGTHPVASYVNSAT